MPSAGSQIVGGWPEESREAARLVIEQYGESSEATAFKPADGGAADPDTRMLSDDDLERAAEEGKSKQKAG